MEDTIITHSELGFHYISITDHDTVISQEQLQHIRKRWTHIVYINGIEITTQFRHKPVHVLAYHRAQVPHSLVNYVQSNIMRNRILYIRYIKGNLCMRPPDNMIAIIEKIHDLGGIAILPHPIQYLDCLPELLPYFDGIECIHPLHDNSIVEDMFQLCQRKKLFCSAGTDFHDAFVGLDRYRFLCSKYRHRLEALISAVTQLR